jgi:hypothetical protein
MGCRPPPKEDLTGQAQIYPVESRHFRVCFAEFNRASTGHFFSPVDLTGEKLSACNAGFVCTPGQVIHHSIVFMSPMRHCFFV